MLRVVSVLALACLFAPHALANVARPLTRAALDRVCLYSLTNTGAAVITPAACDRVVVTATTGAATIYLDPVTAGGRVGQVLPVTVRNDSGGAITTTWALASFKMATWTNPANGNSRSVLFRFDGNYWVEVSRTPADVPN